MDTDSQGRVATDAAEHLRLILDTANDAFVGIDEGGCVIDWNRQAEQMFGWSADEAHGRPLTELMIPEEYHEAHLRGLNHFLATGEGPVLFERMDVPAVDRSGRRLNVEITIWPSKMAGRWRFNAFLRDVTDQRRQDAYAALVSDVTALANGSMTPEPAVRHALEEITALMDWSLGHGWIVDDTRDHLRPTGWWAGDIDRFATFVDVTDGLSLARGQGLAGRTAATGRLASTVDVRDEADFRRLRAAAADGLHGAVAVPVLVGDTAVAVLEFYTPARYEVDDRVADVMADVGVQLGRVFEREAAIEQARDSERFKTRMLSVLAHDLQAPAGAIAGFADLLREEWPEIDDDTAVEWLDAIRRQSEQIDQLIAELLTVQRLQIGAQTSDPREVDADDVIRTVVNDLQLDDVVRLDVTRPLRVHADPAQLTRMLTNLLGNADKHGRPPIIVDGETDGGHVRIGVEDRGEGVADGLVDHLFEPFAADEPTTGTGLGLSIVHQLAELNDGELTYHAADPSGACFVLVLPSV